MVGDNIKKRRRVSADGYVFVVLSLVSLSVLLFSARSFVVDFKDMGLSVYSGLRGSLFKLTSFVSQTILSVQELARLKEEYDELAARMTRYEQLERTAADIRQENNRLREQLNFSRTLTYRYVAAEIVARDPDNLFSAFVINKGRNNGVASNMPVVAYQNGVEILVGKVVQTANLESFVMPLYDSSSYISARLAESRIEGIVEGQGGPDEPLLLRFVRRTRGEISIGEPVVSSGLGRVFPPGVNLGRVSRVIYQDNNNSVEIELESSADFSRLEYVFVIDIRQSAGSAPVPAEEAAPASPAAADGGP
ncbi:MAG: rod shape-determining protein MreC [Treponema sp.]|jgi:rod shape-determining protein MreC|nr:rod shape-determining protein MreC [Treponema sp.]